MKLWTLYSLYAMGIASGLTLTSICAYRLYWLALQRATWPNAANQQGLVNQSVRQPFLRKVPSEAEQQQAAVQKALALVETRKETVATLIHKRFELLAQDQALTSQLMDARLTVSQREQVFSQKQQLNQQWGALSTELKMAKVNWETATANLELVSGY